MKKIILGITAVFLISAAFAQRSADAVRVSYPDSESYKGDYVEVKYTYAPLSSAEYQNLVAAGAKPILDKLGFVAKASKIKDVKEAENVVKSLNEKEKQQLSGEVKEILKSVKGHDEIFKQINAKLAKFARVYSSEQSFSDKCPITSMAEAYDGEITGNDVFLINSSCQILNTYQGKQREMVFFKTFETKEGKTIKLETNRISADTIYDKNGKVKHTSKGICWSIMRYYFFANDELILTISEPSLDYH